ncbi:MAG: magnesium transporter [Candidatus Eisenbacteria bacterium]
MEQTSPSSQEFHDDLRALIATRNEQLLRALLAQLHPADLADVLEHLDEEDRVFVFGLVAPTERPQAVAEMDEGVRERLLGELKTSEIADLVEELDSDDAVDLVQDLSAEVAEQVLTEVSDAESRRVRRLLAYPEDTAGGIMAAEVVAVPERDTVAQAIERLRAAGEAQADIPHLFVVGENGRLRGTLRLRDMLLSDPHRSVGEITQREFWSVPATMDQEEVAELVRKYDLAVVPVVDERGRLIGQITLDDILDVYEEEASEDFARMSGGLTDESPHDSWLSISRNRLPWLFLGLAGGTVSAYVISHFVPGFDFQDALQVAFFIPVITAMGGNVGMQSSAMMVRGLATGEIAEATSRSRLLKEIGVGALNAIVLALVLWAIVSLWLGRWRLAAIVGVSLSCSMTVAAAIGSAVPLALKRLGVDPALATGPFVTTSNDIIGLSIYLGATTLLLGWI